MLGPQFGGQCLSSGHLAHLWCPMPEPCNVITFPASCLCWEMFSWFFFLPFLCLVFHLLSWPPFLKSKLTFIDSFDQLRCILNLVHLDPLKKAPAGPHVLCALPWPSLAEPLSMEWKVCRVKGARWTRALTPPQTQTWTPEFPTPPAPDSL